MADGFHIQIDEEQAACIRALAESLGREPEDYLRAVIDQAFEHDWAEDERRWAEYERTGESISLDEFMGELTAAVAKRRVSR